MDLARYWRAHQVKRLLDVEYLRSLYLQRKYKPTPAEWRQIASHDRLIKPE
jgi:hypothetical protein